MTPQRFSVLMGQLRARYGYQQTDPDQWKLTVAAYFKETAKRDDDLVEMALDRAWGDHREWFPTLGQLIDIVDMLKRTRRVGESHRLTEGEPFADPEAAKERIGEILKSLSPGSEMPKGNAPSRPKTEQEITKALKDEEAGEIACDDCKADGICDEHMPF